MSESRVRENRMPGLTGGRWRSGSHGEPEPCARRETGGTEPDHLPLADPPAAYLTGFRYLETDASDDSRPILERLGFTAVTSTTPYVWSPPPVPAADL